MQLQSIVLRILIALLFWSSAGVAADPLKFVSVRAWKTVGEADFAASCLEPAPSRSPRYWGELGQPDAFPPELTDEVLRVPWLLERPSFGVAFSGGGTRSATATLGQLRALHDLGWIAQARYFSANSGSTWTLVPYIYLPERISDRRFLGPLVPPARIDRSTLAPTAPDPKAMSTALHESRVGRRIGSLIKGDEAYADIVGSIFLKPFDLHEVKKVFTFHRAALDAALRGNPKLRESDFIGLEKEDRPYPILTGTMLARQLTKDPQDYFPVEMTPLYSGIRRRYCFEKDGEIVVVGGGYVESFGYDSYEPEEQAVGGRYSVRIRGHLSRGDNPLSKRYRFALSDTIGISSAAPLATLSGNFVPNLIFPELREWPVDRGAISRTGGTARVQADEYQHADGGDLDNLAVMPLLARGVENILVFVNTSHPFEEPATGCAAGNRDFLVDDVISLFTKIDQLIHNQVIADREQGLLELCDSLARKKAAGEPLVHCQTYNILSNPRYGVEPYSANICFAYLDRTQRWIDLVPKTDELNRALHDRQSPFDNFPHYRTFLERGALLIDFDRERVHALSNLTAWSLRESAEIVRQALPGAELPARQP